MLELTNKLPSSRKILKRKRKRRQLLLINPKRIIQLQVMWLRMLTKVPRGIAIEIHGEIIIRQKIMKERD